MKTLAGFLLLILMPFTVHAIVEDYSSVCIKQLDRYKHSALNIFRDAVDIAGFMIGGSFEDSDEQLSQARTLCYDPRAKRPIAYICIQANVDKYTRFKFSLYNIEQCLQLDSRESSECVKTRVDRDEGMFLADKFCLDKNWKARIRDIDARRRQYDLRFRRKCRGW